MGASGSSFLDCARLASSLLAGKWSQTEGNVLSPRLRVVTRWLLAGMAGVGRRPGGAWYFQVLLVDVAVAFILTSVFSFIFDHQGYTHTHTPNLVGRIAR